jgi:hypothetical protein
VLLPDDNSYLVLHVRTCKNRTYHGGTLRLKKPDIQQVCQAGSCLLCVVLDLRITSGLGESEFSGGWLTGPLLSMDNIGTALFVLAIALTFVVPRVAAATGLASTLLCVPLYLFFIAPVAFAQIFAPGHEFKGYVAPGFHWHTWPVAELLALTLTVYVCVRGTAATSWKDINSKDMPPNRLPRINY